MSDFTHFDKEGKVVMVDVSDKDTTERTATAKGSVLMEAYTLAKIEEGAVGKGDVLGIARTAGIMAAKRTSELIPLCHPLALNTVTVNLTCDKGRNAVDIVATCCCIGRTGIEMEALTAVSVTALTVYDMCKAMDRSMRMTDIRLTNKSGGKSGIYESE